MKDSVITEMHQIKHAIAAENRNDVRAIVASVRKQIRVPATRVMQPQKKKRSPRPTVRSR